MNSQVMEWRVHPRFPKYEVSEYGDIRRLTDSPTRKKGTYVRGSIDIDGYIVHKLLNEDDVKVRIHLHRLVIEAYIGFSPDPDFEVAHSNGSRVFNHFTNLSWKSNIDNQHDRDVHGTSPKGEQNGRAMLTEDDVKLIRSERRSGELSRRRTNEHARRVGVSESAIYNAANGKTWKHVA